MKWVLPRYRNRELDKNVFNKLRIRYLIGLIAIAITVIFSEHLVRNNLKEQLHDSRVINVAGRQRMLSQKITKTILLTERVPDRSHLLVLTKELRSVLKLWDLSHNGLRFGNDSLGLPKWESAVIDSMYLKLSPYYATIYANTHHVIVLASDTLSPGKPELGSKIDTVLKYEPLFLMGMDSIVFQYDKEAKGKVRDLIQTELFLLILSLLILLSELLFIFTPVAIYIRKIIANLLASEAKERAMNIELRELYASLEHSQKELKDVYFAVDQAIMFARTNLYGDISFISDKFIENLGGRFPQGQFNIFQLIRSDELNSVSFQKNLLKVKAGEIIRTELKIQHPTREYAWLMITMVPVPGENGGITQMVMVCVDVTERKTAEGLLQKAVKERYEQEVTQERLKTSLIFEGQEQERRRIAREIHDGVGQLLTGLKFQIESLDNPARALDMLKVEKIRNLIGEIIKEVRKVSFNIIPSGLSDFGLVAALQAMVRNSNGFTNAQVKFVNSTGFDQRLDKEVETNIFRITQEALNNALKYSQAETILVSLDHKKNKLKITIDDNGTGFDVKTSIRGRNKIQGHGIMNMRERAEFIRAKLEISSSPGKGTVVKFEIPLGIQDV